MEYSREMILEQKNLFLVMYWIIGTGSESMSFVQGMSTASWPPDMSTKRTLVPIWYRAPLDTQWLQYDNERDDGLYSLT